MCKYVSPKYVFLQNMCKYVQICFSKICVSPKYVQICANKFFQKGKYFKYVQICLFQNTHSCFQLNTTKMFSFKAANCLKHFQMFSTQF